MHRSVAAHHPSITRDQPQQTEQAREEKPAEVDPPPARDGGTGRDAQEHQGEDDGECLAERSEKGLRDLDHQKLEHRGADAGRGQREQMTPRHGERFQCGRGRHAQFAKAEQEAEGDKSIQRRHREHRRPDAQFAKQPELDEQNRERRAEVIDHVSPGKDPPAAQPVEVAGEERKAAPDQKGRRAQQDEADQHRAAHVTAQRAGRVIPFLHTARAERKRRAEHPDASLHKPEPAPQTMGVESPKPDAEHEREQDGGADQKLVTDEIAQDSGVKHLVGNAAKAGEQHQEGKAQTP